MASLQEPQSARDWLKRPGLEIHVDFLEQLEFLAPFSFPFRISFAWSCDEKDKADIVCIRAVMPVDDITLSNVAVIEKAEYVKGQRKAVGFLVSHSDYTKLLDAQKQLLENLQMPLTSLSRLYGRLDHEHLEFRFANWPEGTRDAVKEGFRKEHLTSCGSDISPEGIRNAAVHQFIRNLAADNSG